MVDNSQSEKENGFYDIIRQALTDEDFLEKFKKIETLRDLKIFFLVDNPFYGLSTEQINRLYTYRNKICVDVKAALAAEDTVALALECEKVGDIACDIGYFEAILLMQTDEGLLEKSKKIETLRDFKILFLVDNPSSRLSTEQIERIWAYRNELCESAKFTREQIGDIVCGQGY